MKGHVITSPHLLSAAGVEISSQENHGGGGGGISAGGSYRIALSKSLKFFVPITTKNTHSVLTKKNHEIPLLTCTA